MKTSTSVIAASASASATPAAAPSESAWSSRLTRRLASNVVWSMIAEVVGRGSVLVGNLFIAQALGVEAFGVLTAAQALATCFWIAIDFGVGMYGVREVARGRESGEDVITPLFNLRLLMCGLTLPVFAAAVLWKGGSPLTMTVHLACGLSLVGLAIHPHWALRGLERFRLIALGNALSAVVYLGGAWWWVRSPEDAAAAGLLWSAWFLVSGILLILLLRREKVSFRLAWQPELWARHMRASFFFATSGAMVLAYHYAPVLLLECWSSDYEVGLFGPPFRIILAVGAAAFLAPSSFYPVLSKLHLQDPLRFDHARLRLQLLSALCGLLAGGALWALARPLTERCLGSAFSGSGDVLLVLAWMAPAQFLRNAFRVVLMAADLQRGVNAGFLAGVAATIVLSAVWIPSGGALGAAWALVCGECVMTVSLGALAFGGVRRQRAARDSRRRLAEGGEAS